MEGGREREEGGEGRRKEEGREISVSASVCGRYKGGGRTREEGGVEKAEDKSAVATFVIGLLVLEIALGRRLLVAEV